jgi:hypothetical protein
MSHAEARAEVSRLADEQAALRRVAPLVARDAAPGEVFATVAKEVARLLEVDDVLIDRFEPEGTVTVVGAWGDVADFTGLPLGGRNVVSEVHPTGRPARSDEFPPRLGSLLRRRARARGASPDPGRDQPRLPDPRRGAGAGHLLGDR